MQRPGLWHVTLIVTSSMTLTWCMQFAPCYWLLRTMSSGCFSWCPLLMPWKFKVTETNTEVRNEHCANFLTINCVQDLPTNELSIISTKKECTSVEDRVVETNSKAVVRRINSYPAWTCHLSNAHLHPGIASAWKRTSEHLGSEGVYLCRVWGPRYGD